MYAKRPHISLPILHKELFPETAIPCPLRVCPGLPEADDPAYALMDWPLSPIEASHILHEIDDLARSAPSLEALRVQQHMSEEYHAARHVARDVQHALGKPVDSDAKKRYAIARLNAQRALLAVWSQEEQVLELAKLEIRADKEAASLQRLLDGNTMPEIKIHMDPDPALLPDWRRVMEHVAVFLPQEAVLCVSDSRVLSFMEEIGLIAAPSGLNLAQQQSPRDTSSQEKSFTLWRVLGHDRPQSGKPWLDAAYTFFLPASTKETLS